MAPMNEDDILFRVVESMCTFPQVCLQALAAPPRLCAELCGE
jgi:hypothetical protein